MIDRLREWAGNLWDRIVWIAGMPGYYAGEAWESLVGRWRQRRMEMEGSTFWQRMTHRLSLPFYMFMAFFRMLGNYLLTVWYGANLRTLLEGLPALLVAIGVAAITYVAMHQTPEKLVRGYEVAGQTALSEKDFDAAIVYYERLAQMNPDEQSHRYQLAITALQNEDIIRGMKLLAELAPEDRHGYGPAHYFMAQHYLRAERSVQSMERAKAHLLKTIKASPGDVRARSMLGRLYMSLGRSDLALEHMGYAAMADPTQRLSYAWLLALQNRKGQAREEAERAKQYFRERTDADPDDHSSRILWADSCIFLGEFKEAARILEEGLDLTQDVRYSKALSRVFMDWAASIGRDVRSDPTEEFVLLEKALNTWPANPTLLQRIMVLARSEGIEAERSRDMLNEMLARGRAPSIVHLILGTDALVREELPTARGHFEQAHQLNPRMPLVANNLAWLLSAINPPDLPRALNMINAVIERDSNNPIFHSTRGQILVKMGRHDEALPDLQIALAQFGEDPSLHQLLAECYDAKGMTDLAAKHRQLANKFATSGEGATRG